MKRKEDDLARLDGKAVPTWLKVVIFIVSFVVAFVFYRFFIGWVF